MAPSNSMNTMTRPLRTRPSKRSGFETGVSAAIVDMALSLEIGDACLQDEQGRRGTTGGMKKILLVMPGLVPGMTKKSFPSPLWEKEKLLRLGAVRGAVADQ